MGVACCIANLSLHAAQQRLIGITVCILCQEREKQCWDLPTAMSTAQAGTPSIRYLQAARKRHSNHVISLHLNVAPSTSTAPDTTSCTTSKFKYLNRHLINRRCCYTMHRSGSYKPPEGSWTWQHGIFHTAASAGMSGCFYHQVGKLASQNSDLWCRRIAHFACTK